MPKYEQVVPFNKIDKEKVLAIGYQAMQQLNWDISFVVEDSLVGNTKKNWKTKGQQIVLTVAGSSFTVTSNMVNGELSDISGKNKKNVAAFINAFEIVKDTVEAPKIEALKNDVEMLRAGTIKTVEDDAKEEAAMNEAMHMAGSNLFATYSIMAINLLVFILMVVNGAGLFEPDGYVHIKWGSNYTPLTLSGDWWRLITNIFIHFGFIHLAMNMYCLYTVGIYLEPMLGKVRYLTAYLCTGVLAGIVSLWWHKEWVNSAGASGAIFGIYGLFLALLTTKLIPEKIRKTLLLSIGIFVAYNLIYGLKSGIDNSAHVGGLVTGFVFGYGIVYSIKKEKEKLPVAWMIPAIALLTVLITYVYLAQNKIPLAERTIAINELKTASYKDNEKFNKSLARFDEIHRVINDLVGDTSFTDEIFKNKIDTIGFPQLQQAAQLISASNKYDISPASHKKADKLLQYIALRKNELELLKQMIETKNTDELMPQLNNIRTKSNVVFEEVLKL